MTFLAKATVSKEGQGGFDFGSEYNRHRILKWLKEHVGHQIRIEPLTPKRSVQQNKFYWLYLEKIEFETGNSAADLHEYFKRKHLPPKFINIYEFKRDDQGKFIGGQDKKEIKIPGSTTDQSKVEFGNYMEKICAETNVEIPDAEAYNKWLNSAPSAGAKFNEKKNGKSKT